MTRHRRFPRSTLLGTVVLALWAAGPPVRAGIPHSSLGPWRSAEGDCRLRVEAERIVRLDGGKLSVEGIVRYAPGGALTVRIDGTLHERTFVVNGERLSFGEPGNAARYVRVADFVPELLLSPLQIPQPRELPEARIREIREEIPRRLKQDQAVLKNADHTDEEWDRVTSANTAYLETLIQDVGWIDVERFGVEASGNAIVLVKHGQKLPLMLGVLPWVERDAISTGKLGQTFAILYDSVQLKTGGRQRYGTQIGSDEEGDPVIRALEDPARVDGFRESIGLQPLSAYLAMAGEYLFDGKTITVAEERLERVADPRGSSDTRPRVKLVRDGAAVELPADVEGGFIERVEAFFEGCGVVSEARPADASIEPVGGDGEAASYLFLRYPQAVALRGYDGRLGARELLVMLPESFVGSQLARSADGVRSFGKCQGLRALELMCAERLGSYLPDSYAASCRGVEPRSQD